MRLDVLQVQNIRHDVVECGKDDAAVNGIFVADMIESWAELAGTDPVTQDKTDVQAYRILRAAGEAHFRFFDGYG
jgi:hypothetical protein